MRGAFGGRRGGVQAKGMICVPVFPSRPIRSRQAYDNGRVAPRKIPFVPLTAALRTCRAPALTQKCTVLEENVATQSMMTTNQPCLFRILVGQCHQQLRENAPLSLRMTLKISKYFVPPSPLPPICSRPDLPVRVAVGLGEFLLGEVGKCWHGGLAELRAVLQQNQDEARVLQRAQEGEGKAEQARNG